MILEAQRPSSEPDWPKELRIFENFLHRFGVDINQVADRSFIETQLGVPKNIERGYSVHASVKFEEMKLPPYWSHGFSERHSSKDRQVPVLYVAQHLKDAIVATCGESQFENFNAHITVLLNFANHDFTARAIGIDSGSRAIAAIGTVVRFEENRWVGKDLSERLAAISHRILFEKACQQSPRLKQYVVREAREAMRVLQKLDEKSRAELTSAIRYLLYCLVDPGDSVLQPLRTKYSNGSFEALPMTEWAGIVHQHRFKLRGSDTYVTDEDMFKILYSHPANPSIAPGKRRVSVAEEGQYQKEIEALVKAAAR